MNINVKKSGFGLKVYYGDTLHLMLPNAVDYFYAYIDVHREYRYIIEFQVNGKKNIIEYEKKRDWRKVLKAIDDNYD